MVLLSVIEALPNNIQFFNRLKCSNGVTASFTF
ncbi:hypothetical protein DTO96_102244 [Ephemeroptericola cinctiostellae]|uniref:Uncharacterized protein n=1 Tax=Ephemeroptericola cinctiostellae TaxID=2268024 RepID=A0A345DDQ2_9BURK|nr:hypothetical protein DTO96_102244 [Ephemeroptericola cinctiostellae]